MGKIHVAMVGAGQIAKLHAAGYAADPRVSVRAVCDQREDVAIAHSLEWSADDYYLNYQDLLQDPNVHAVDIMTPHYLHASFVLDAIQAGKHVLVSRPIALTLAEADQIIQEAERRERIVAVCEPQLFLPAVQEAKAYVDAGEIGEPISVRIRVGIGAPEGGWEIKPDSWLWRFDPQKCGGGPFLFDAVYGSLVMASQLLGKVEVLQAWIGRTEIYPGYYVDAPATLMWRHHKTGCVGSLELTYAPEMFIKSDQYPEDTVLEITGTRGMLRAHASPGRLEPRAALEMYRDGRTFVFGEVDGRWEKSFERATSNFVSAMLGEADAVCPADLGREHLKLTLAARDSSLSQRIHRLSP